jgi:AAA15 family ATPase/GTPase
LLLNFFSLPLNNSIMELHHFFSGLRVPEIEAATISDSEGNEIEYLTGLSKVNIFIGPNNSGKSLFLRELLKREIEFTYPSETLLESIQIYIEEALLHIKHIFDSYQTLVLQAPNNVQLKYEEIATELKSIQGKNIKEYNSRVDKLIIKIQSSQYTYVVLKHGGATNVGLNLDKALKSITPEINKILDLLIPQFKINRVYVPTRRSLVKHTPTVVEELGRDVYHFNPKKSPTDESEFFSGNVKMNNGYTFFDEIKNLQSTQEGDEILENFQNYISLHFFANQKIILRPNHNTNVLNITIGDEKEQPIFRLGDGLQMIILITFILFNYNNGFIVIEEPEIFLHPGLQKQLIRLLADDPQAKNFIFFFATHSNHTIESVSLSQNISLFKINKLVERKKMSFPSFQLFPINFGNSDVLKDLGVTNNSIFLSNCTLWVEGITDKLYIQKYLKCFIDSNPTGKYRNIYKILEGISYSFVFTAGDNIIHYDFAEGSEVTDIAEKNTVKYICGKSMVIVDNDNGKNNQRKKQLEEELGIRFIVLPVVEIENLISPEVLVKTIKRFPTWKNLDESKVPDFQQEQYNDNNLGTFIDDYLLKNLRNGKQKRFSYKPGKSAEPPFTLNCKSEFCQYAIEETSYENMSESAKKLTSKILDFILEENPELM